MLLKKGFTLIEAVLTLLIFSALIVIGSYQVKDYQRHTEERLALKQFEFKWNQAVTTAYLEHTLCHVVFESKKIQFEFGPNIVESFDLPGTLTNENKDEISIDKNGTTGPASIRFYTDSTVQHFYTVQMNWGVLVAKNP